jgi:hypothetical protein
MRHVSAPQVGHSTRLRPFRRGVSSCVIDRPSPANESMTGAGNGVIHPCYLDRRRNNRASRQMRGGVDGASVRAVAFP